MSSENETGNNESNGGNSSTFKSGNNHLAGTIVRGDTYTNLSKISIGLEDDEDEKESVTAPRKKNLDYRGTKSKFTDKIIEY